MPQYTEQISLPLTPRQLKWLETERKRKGYKSIQRVLRDWINCAIVRNNQEAFDAAQH
jgi:hypothetical protein